jgi:hypothetical protein
MEQYFSCKYSTSCSSIKASSCSSCLWLTQSGAAVQHSSSASSAMMGQLRGQRQQPQQQQQQSQLQRQQSEQEQLHGQQQQRQQQQQQHQTTCKDVPGGKSDQQLPAWVPSQQQANHVGGRCLTSS